MASWEPRDGETSKAYGRFVAYLELGHERSLAKLTRIMGRKASYITQLKKWSARHSWVARAKDYDAAELAELVEQRKQLRERMRQELYDEATAAVQTVLATVRGECPIPPCSCGAGDPADCRCDPVTTPVLDRHGREIGSKPLVAPSTRLQGALAVLDRIGLNVPKRMELSGPDGEGLEVELRASLGSLSDSQLAAVAAAVVIEEDA